MENIRDRTQQRREVIPLFFMYYIVLAALMPAAKEGFYYDLLCWQQWCVAIMEDGIGNIYDTKCNYPPVFLYLLWFWGKIMGSAEMVEAQTRYIRLIPIAFEFLTAIAVWWFVPKSRPYAPFILLFNMAMLFDSVIWGQLDGIYTCGVVWALYCAWQRKWEWAAVLMILSLNMKLQAVVFVPVVGLLFLPMLLEEWRRIFPVLGAAVMTQGLLLLPFILEGKVGDWWDRIYGLVGYYPKVSVSGMNFWYIIIGDVTPQTILDTDLWGPLPYKTWGLLFMSLTVGPILAAFTWQLVRQRLDLIQHPKGLSLLLVTAAWTQLAFFFFVTQMHERYAYPVLALLFLYGVLERRYLPYFCASFYFFINIEEVMRRWPKLFYQHTFLFENAFIGVLCLIALGVVGYEWWRCWRTIRGGQVVDAA